MRKEKSHKSMFNKHESVNPHLKSGIRSATDISYGMGKMGEIGQEGHIFHCDAFEGQKEDMSRLKVEPDNNRGYPSEAFHYNY